MAIPVTAADLDSQAAGAPHGELQVSPGCHPADGLIVFYRGGVMGLYCNGPGCGAEVLAVRVAPGKALLKLASSS